MVSTRSKKKFDAKGTNKRLEEVKDEFKMNSREFMEIIRLVRLGMQNQCCVQRCCLCLVERDFFKA